MALPRNLYELRQRWSQGERFHFFFFYGHNPPVEGVDSSCLSQWFHKPFQVDGVIYPTAEHWMMAEKARLFGDQAALTKILASFEPREAKALGREVENFDPSIWDKHKFEIVKAGNRAKFSQHADLKAYLIKTAHVEVESQLRLVAEQPANYESKTKKKTSKKKDRANADEVNEPMMRYRASKTIANQVAASRQTTSSTILVEAAGRDTIWGIGLGAANPNAQDLQKWHGLNLLGFALTELQTG